MRSRIFKKTRFGKIGIEENDGRITHVYLSNDVPATEAKQLETALLKEAFSQLDEYFEGTRRKFDLPLEPEGTEFMKTVWNELQKIVFGKTVTYKTIAEQIGNPKATRAVGMANNRNPIPIFIPCHRVIGSNGRLVGYRGGLELKQRLLKQEGCKDDILLQ